MTGIPHRGLGVQSKSTDSVKGRSLLSERAHRSAYVPPHLSAKPQVFFGASQELSARHPVSQARPWRQHLVSSPGCFSITTHPARASRDTASPTMHHVLALTAVASALAVAGLCSVPSVASLVTRARRRGPKRDIYADADGTATQESMAAYSAKVPKILVLLFAATGCGLAIALAVLPGGVEGVPLATWLGVGAWVCTRAQALTVMTAPYRARAC